MNHRLYRIIFNKKRGQLMVVAESAISDGKSTGTTKRAGSGESPYVTMLRPASFAILVALGLVAFAAPQAHAQIVAYKAAPAGQQATVLSAGNGVPLVNIRTPSAGGVSRNTFSQFDVQQQGAILNNAHANAKTQLGGWVQGNPWLAAGTARVILNEVVSASPSLLGGYVEVAGDRAQVVIANPAGVTCSGCGFINASRATLTTGTPIMNGGNLQGYRVEGGDIRIEGAGMDASGATQTDLITRAVRVNAGLWANALNISTGVNQVDADNTVATPSTGGSTPAPAFALDVAALGGMYAGKITLVGTEAGVGVRNAGQIGASAGDVVVTANGQLINNGAISSSAATRVDTVAGISNSGTIYAKGDTRLSTQGDIDHTGVIAAQNDVVLSATGSGSRIQASTDAVVGAGLLSDGTLGGNGHVNINANGEAALHGQNVASGDLRVAARTVNLAGSQTLARNLNLHAASGDINVRNAVLTADETLTASTTQTLQHDGASSSARQLQLNAHDLSNQHGELIQSGSGATAISLAGSLDNTAGKLAVNSQDLGLSAQTINNTNGVIVHAGAGEMRINTSTRLDNGGGSLESAGHAVLNVDDLDNRNGTLHATGGTGLELTATGTVDNRHGEISTGGDITLAAQSLQNTQGQVSASQGLQASTNGTIDNTQGRLVANGNARVRANGVDNTQGVIGSVSGGTDIDAGNLALGNRAGRIEAAQDISIAGRTLVNVNGLVVGKNLAIDSRLQSTDNTRGTISANGTLDLASGEVLNETGLIQATGVLNINTHGQRFANTHSGSTGGIVGQDSVTLNTGDFENDAGFVGAQNSLALNATTLSNTSGGMLSGAGDLQLSGSSLDNRGGQIQAVGDVHAEIGGTVDDRSSLIRAGQTLSIDAVSIDNRDSQGTDQGIEAASLDLVAASIDNTHGALRANDALTLTSSGTVNNTHGLVSSADTLTIKDTATDKTLAVTNTGGILIADQALTIDSASLSNSGRILGVTDVDIKLADDLAHGGEITANRNARVETAGVLTNNGIVQAGDTLTVTAATLNNAATGTLKATRTQLTATDSHTLENRGLIDGSDTFIDSITVNNLGTGRIYGDHVAIAATTLTNAAETVAGTSSAPVIAARDRLDIGATTIDNLQGAMLFSAGDLALGGALDTDHHATGRAGTLNNVGATIEALGKVSIDAAQINNRNAGLTTHEVNTGSTSVTEYQGSGAATRYLAGTSGVYIYEDESDHLHTPEGNYSSWLAYRYTRTTTETQVLTSAPGEILSGGAMALSADAVLNDNSRIVAGGTLSATAGTIENRETTGERTITEAGTVTSYWRDHEKGRDDTGRSTAAYNPPATIQTISLGTTVYQAGTAPGGIGTSVASLTLGGVGQNADGASGSAVAANGLRAVARIVEVNATNSSGPAMLVRSISPNLTLPNSSLYRHSPNPTAHYLIETDPAFASYRTWLTSDYMLQQLALDPATTQKRLGDGFYEQRLIREQVAQLTGRRFLDGYSDDEAQYAGLMNAGVTFARTWNLIPGVALSAEQMAALTTDIVWLVEKDIDLGNGRTGKALVPQVYARVQSTDLAPSGALIAANDIDLNLSGDPSAGSGGTLTNQGTIAGRRVVALTAENIRNLGGRIAGESVGLAARTDLANLGGTVQASDTLLASAGRDLTVASTTRTQANAHGSRTNVNRVAGLYVTGKSDGNGGTLVASAGNDLTLLAAALINSQPTAAGVSAPDAASASKGTTRLQAGHDLTLGTVSEASSNHLVWDRRNTRDDAHQSDVGTTIQTTGDLQLLAGHDLSARAASVTSDAGALSAVAGHDLSITSGTSADQVDERHRHKEKGFLSSKTRTTRDTLDSTTALASTFSGETTDLVAGRDIGVKGSNVVSTNETALTAGRNLAIESATENHAETHFKKTKQSGVFGSGGVGFRSSPRSAALRQAQDRPIS